MKMIISLVLAITLGLAITLPFVPMTSSHTLTWTMAVSNDPPPPGPCPGGPPCDPPPPGPCPGGPPCN
jgi:hypothetical protein